MKIIIIGQGGHSKVIRDIISTNKQMSVFGFLDDKYNVLTINEGRITGPVSSANEIAKYYDDVRFIVGIGNNVIRKNIIEPLNFPNHFYITIKHQSALISPSASIGHGTVIMANTIINSDSIIGNHSILNSGAIVEHDCCIGNYVHISPNATLTGSVTIEEGVHVGATASIIPGKSIGKWSTIGAGATVIHDIPNHCTAVGVPAKVNRKEGVEFVKNYK